MKDVTVTNIPSMHIGRIIDTLSTAYCTIINKKLPLKTLPSVMLWGAPGVGKSQAIRQLAREIEQCTAKKTVITDVRLLLFNPIDLRGIPTANAEKTLAIWLRPQIFQMDDSDDVDAMRPLIAGLVGNGVAAEFRTWANVYKDLPSLEDIFGGKMPPVPTAPDALYALAAAMTSYAKDHKDDLRLIANSVVFASRLPPDYAAMLLKDYMYIEKGYKEKLLKIPEFSRWLSSKGRMLNGSV